MSDAIEPGDGHLWPSYEQRLLLRAALGERGAVDAFREWRTLVDMDEEFGWASVRLMPMVYSTLTRLGAPDPVLGRLKGVYRRAWYETHQLFQRTDPAVRLMRDAGIDVLLLKGAPLAIAYYRNHALRPMSDLDVCVRPSDAHRAAELLVAAGWKPFWDVDDQLFRFRHALQLRHENGGEIDLHWHVMPETSRGSLDARCWDDTEPLDFRGTRVLQLAPTTLLLHTILHGVRWNEETPIRWIPDSLAILRERGADVDWDRLVRDARAMRASARLEMGLRYLRDEFGAIVPRRALTVLRAANRSIVERMEQTVLLRDVNAATRPALAYQWSLLVDYVRVIDPFTQPLRFVRVYPHYLRFRMEVGGRRDIVKMLVRSLGRRAAAL